jgi:hypothetical protein
MEMSGCPEKNSGVGCVRVCLGIGMMLARCWDWGRDEEKKTADVRSEAR